MADGGTRTVPAPAPAPPMSRQSPEHSRATLAATILGSSLAFIDGSVVNVALPALGNSLRAGATELPWTIDAYLLPLGALILLGGGLGDHYGRRRLFLIGLTVFTTASLLCAAAPTLAWLIAARGLQGVGAALLMPNSLAILGSRFQGEARGRAIGLWAAVGAIAGAVGPVVGGWLVDTFGWRVIFLINVPIALAAGTIAVSYLDENTGESTRPLDWLGAGLANAGLGMLTWWLTETTGTGMAAAISFAAGASGIALLLAFVWHEHRLGAAALMPLGLFASATFVGLTLLTLLTYGSVGGLLVLLPFFLIRIAHWSAVAAGAALLPVPTVIGLGSRAMGRLTARYGGRMPLTLGSGLVAAGIALYARIDTSTVFYWSDIFPPTLLVALGMAMTAAPLTTSVMESVDADHVGIASGFNSAMARIGGLIATALSGYVFSRQASSAEFIGGMRLSAGIGSAAALLSGLCAFTLLRKKG